MINIFFTCCGIFAFIISLSNLSKINIIQRTLRNNSDEENREDIKAILTAYIGKNIYLDFYEYEVSINLLDHGKYMTYTLIDLDDQWALIHVQAPKKEYDQLIRLSSIKSVTEK